MGRLFWKFFFSYWAALLVAVLCVGMAAWLHQLGEQRQDLSLEAGPRAAFLVGSSAVTLQHGGLPALRELMEEWRRHGDVLPFAVDEDDRDMLGRPVAIDALTRARELAEGSEKPDGVRRVDLADGESILLYVPVHGVPLLQRVLPRGGPPSPLVPLIAGMLASLVFGSLLAWYVARPIFHLRAAFAALSHGRLETRVASLIGRRRDEVADLGRDFDRMAQQLQDLISAQRTLLHEVSHELRSPLARLQAAIGLARQNPDKLESSLERIEQEAERVDDLIGQLLTLSRLEAGICDGSRERVECVDLVDIVASVAADAHFEAQGTGRSVVFQGQGEIVADVDAELLHRAVENVIRNAIKYTPPGTAVDVSAKANASGDTFVVRVADRGPGVAETELETIFQPFYRSAARPPGSGFGLGLAIARRAVESHGGDVRACNRESGGLVIVISLPLGQRRRSVPS